MSSNWYIYTSQVDGPYTVQELEKFVAAGKVTPTTLVTNGLQGQWVSAATVPGLFGSASAVAQKWAARANAVPPLPGTQALPPPPPLPGGSVSQPPAAPRRFLVWVFGGTAVVSVLLVSLVLAMVWWGPAQAKKKDDEAQQAERERLAAEEEAQKKEDAEKKAEAEVAKHKQEAFESAVARKIRAAAPSPNTLLLTKLRDYRVEKVPLSWTSRSTFVRDSAYENALAHGSPLLIDEHTLALITDLGGQNFQLWHLNLRNGEIRMIKEIADQDPNGKYDYVGCHRINGKLIMQFIAVTTGMFKIVPRFRGYAAYGVLNLETGEIQGKKIEATSDQKLEVLITKLMNDKLSESSTANLPHGTEAVASANERLAQQGLHFDANRASISLLPDLRQRWERELRDLSLSDSKAPAKLIELEEQVGSAAQCPLTSDLKNNLQFAQAIAGENAPEIRSFIQSNGQHALVHPASMTLVHLIAKDNDTVQAYLKFQQEDAGTAARDLAIMRIHELSFTAVCRKATTDGFDDFLMSFPGSLQAKDAFRYAYDLELERARFEIEHADDKDKQREEVANRFGKAWRECVNTGEMSQAERLWKILRDEDDFNHTKAAANAQKAKEQDSYRKKMIALEKERNRILLLLEDIQKRQLAIADQPLLATYEAQAKGRGQVAKLDRVPSKIRALRE